MTRLAHDPLLLRDPGSLRALPFGGSAAMPACLSVKALFVATRRLLENREPERARANLNVEMDGDARRCKSRRQMAARF